MQTGSIPDSDLSASSPFGEDYSTYGAQWARLHLKLPPYHGYRAKQSLRSGGSARNKTWIRIELRNETIITGVSTQGYGDTRVKEWVTKYTLMYSAGSGFLNFRDTSGKTEVSKCLFMAVVKGLGSHCLISSLSIFIIQLWHQKSNKVSLTF